MNLSRVKILSFKCVRDAGLSASVAPLVALIYSIVAKTSCSESTGVGTGATGFYVVIVNPVVLP